MKLLFTVGSHRLTQHLAEGLSSEHEIVLTDDQRHGPPANYVACDLNHDQSTSKLMRGVDAIIHFGWVDPRENVSLQLDRQTRRTFNLLEAASEAGASRVVYLSTLNLMRGYPGDMKVTERWQPLPTSDPVLLAPYLGEIVCREFARERRLQVVCLRLGEILWSQDSGVSPMGLFPGDLDRAVSRAVLAELPAYSVFHIQSKVLGQLYDTAEAEKVLGVEPSGGKG